MCVIQADVDIRHGLVQHVTRERCSHIETGLAECSVMEPLVGSFMFSHHTTGTRLCVCTYSENVLAVPVDSSN